MPGRRSCQHQAGDVDAGNQQNRPHRGQQQKEHEAGLPDQLLLQGNKPAPPLRRGRIVVGILLAQMRGIGIEFGLGLSDAQAGTETCDRARDKPLRAHRRLGKRIGGKSGSDPDLHVLADRASGMTKLRRHDADDRVQVGVEANTLPQHIRIAAEHLVPQAVADDRAVGEPCAGIGCGKDAAQRGLGPQQDEVVGADRVGLHALRLLAAGNVGVDWPDGGDLIEDSGGALEIVQLRLRHANVGLVHARHVVFHGDQLSGLLIRQRPQQNRIDDGKQRRISAHTQSQRQHHDGGESRALAQQSQTVANILQQTLHRSPHLPGHMSPREGAPMLYCIGRCSKSSNRSARTDCVKRLAGEDRTIISERDQQNTSGQPVRINRCVFENEHATPAVFRIRARLQSTSVIPTEDFTLLLSSRPRTSVRPRDLRLAAERRQVSHAACSALPLAITNEGLYQGTASAVPISRSFLIRAGFSRRHNAEC